MQFTALSCFDTIVHASACTHAFNIVAQPKRSAWLRQNAEDVFNAGPLAGPLFESMPDLLFHTPHELLGTVFFVECQDTAKLFQL